MRQLLFATATSILMVAQAPVTMASSAPTDISSQGVYVGPGGVGVDTGVRVRRDREYGEERRSSRGLCAELRQACLNKDRLGEQGEGNCRRYRRTCR